MTQRWREGRESYRPIGEPIDPSDYGVDILDLRPARRFVVGHHYSGSYVAARLQVGLFQSRPFHAAELVGVAVFSVPADPKVLSRWLPKMASVELGRLVLLDQVPANGESWFVARAFRALRQELPEITAVLSFSDPMQRRSIDGRRVTPGHVGTVYQALNGAHLGRSTARTLILAPDGTIVSERALSKLRTGDRGAAYTYALLRRWGAPKMWPGEPGAAYVRRALADRDVWRRVRHPGNIAYGWRIDGTRLGIESLPYLKTGPLPYPKHDAILVAA